MGTFDEPQNHLLAKKMKHLALILIFTFIVSPVLAATKTLNQYSLPPGGTIPGTASMIFQETPVGTGTTYSSPISTIIESVTIPYTSGGTGLTGVGTAGSCLQSTGTGLTYGTCGGGGGTVTPGGSFNSIQYNNAGAFGGIALGTSGLPLLSAGTSTPSYGVLGISGGGTGSPTAQGALNNLNITRNNNSAAYQVVPCQGFSDEQSFATAAANAVSLNLGSILYTTGCVFDNQWKMTAGGSPTIFGFGNFSSELNTTEGGFIGPGRPIMQVFAPAIQGTPGETAIDANGSTQVTFNGVNYFPQNGNGGTPISLFSNSSQAGGCCDQNTLDVINTSMGGADTVIGCPMDGALNCLKAGGAKAGTLTSGGTGYVAGTYTNVPMTGGSGSGLIAQSIVVGTSGVVSAVNLCCNGNPTPGGSYVVGDVVSASNTNLGNSGSGLQFTVSSLYTAGYSAPNMLPYIIGSNFSVITGTHLANNYSDSRIALSTFTGGQVTQPIFGGGDNMWAINRFEDNTNAIDRGANSNGFVGGDTYALNQWTTNSFGGGFDLRLARGGGDLIIGNEIDNESTYSPTGASMIFGGMAAYGFANVVGNIWRNQTVSRTYCVDIPTGFATDYINMQGNICNGSGLIANVNYEQVPVHFVEDFVGPFGRHTEMGRPFAIGTSAPLGTTQAALEVDGTTSIVIPVGNTAQRPTPVEGMVRDNTTNKAVEAYVNGSWTSFSSFTPTNLASYLQGYKNGLTLSNDPTTPNSVIDTSSGVRESDDNSTLMTLASAITKTTGSWVVGSGNGCLDTGTVTTNSWYHIFIIERTDTGVVDELCSLSSWMPVTPAGYGVKGWIGAIKTDGSSHILAFTQDGGTFYEASVLDANAVSIGTTSALQTLGGVPSGVKVNPLIRPTKSLDTTAVLITSPDQPDEVPTGTYPTTSGAGATLIGISTTAQGVIPTVSPAGLKTNSAGQVRVRASATGSTLSIVTYGWIADFGAQISGQIFLTSASSSPLILPNNWNVSTNAIDAIGEGGSGTQFANGGGGGAGGCFSRLVNLSDAAGTSEAFQIGAGGTATTTQFKNGSTLVAGFGPSATGQTGATGCATSTSTGSLKHAGGSGGTVSGSVAGGGGGGGGGGLIGAGANGAADLGSAFGAGGGGADGGSAGSTVTGGNNFGGFGGGATGGNPGIFGGGGGGSATAPPATAGGIGGTGTEYSSLFGSGGGGAGGNGSSFAGCGVGGIGGGYGGGGGGGGTVFGSGTGCASGAGAPGLIVLRWLLP